MSAETVADSIPPGYKQTEVGVISEDWEIIQLKELIHIKNGFAFSSVHFSDKGPILVTPGNFKLKGGLYFDDRNTKRYSGPYSSSMIFSYDDLLIVMTDLTPECHLLGKPAFVQVEETLLHNQRIGKIVPTSKRISLRFLYSFFLSETHAIRMRKTATGSTVRHTSNKTVLDSLIPVPPTLAEQEAIATALSDTDALIESLEQLIAKKRQIKKGAMQELLTGKRRLPGFEVKPGYKQTEVGVIPEDWDVKSLGEISVIVTGNTPATRDPNNYGDEFMFVSPVDLGFSKYISHTEKMLSKKGFSLSRPVPMGSILFVCIGSTIGKCGIALKALTSNQQINAIMPSKEISYEFLYYAVSTVATKVKALAGEQAVPIVNKTQFSETTISIPPTLSEQESIATILSDMDAEITTLEEKLDKTRQIKQGMMQELLTGRIRLV